MIEKIGLKYFFIFICIKFEIFNFKIGYFNIKIEDFNCNFGKFNFEVCILGKFIFNNVVLKCFFLILLFYYF